jgi:hypothetical protein
MHLFTLVAFLTLAGTPNRPIPAGCSEDYGTCREDCTIEFGGSTTKYRQLGECLRSCDKEQTECSRRHYALRDAQMDPTSPSAPASGPRSTPSSGRQGVYRASEAEPATPPEPPAPPPAAPVEPPAKQEPVAAPAPASKPQPAAQPKSASEPEKVEMRTFDDPEPEPEPAPAPKPAPKPVEAPRAQPPAEPKKKDISDWDPNGD